MPGGSRADQATVKKANPKITGSLGFILQFFSILTSGFEQCVCFHPLTPKTSEGTAKGTGDFENCRSVPRSSQKELVPVQFLKKGTSSRNERSFGPFLELFGNMQSY